MKQMLLIPAVLLVACGEEEIKPATKTPANPKAATKTAPASKPKPGLPQSKGNYNTGNPATAPLDYIGATGQAGNRAKYKIQILNAETAIRNFRTLNDRNPANLQEIEGLPQLPGGIQWIYNPQTGQIGIQAR